MDRAELRPVGVPAVVPPRPGARWVPFALGAGLIAVALTAGAVGADSVRGGPAAVDRAAEIVAASLTSDRDDPKVVGSIRALRSDLGRRPLDVRTRVLYAGLLLDRAEREEDRSIASFHARRAARLAPVTVPIARAASVILARAGAPDEALDLVRSMFTYDAAPAAELLASLEPFLPDRSVDRGVPELPQAWLAWALRLGRMGRGSEGQRWIDEGLKRWPDDSGLREEAAGRAAGRADWAELGRLLPRAGSPGPVTLSPRLLAFRARVSAENGDRDGARADADLAIRRGARDPFILSLAADALVAAGDLAEAAALWQEAIYRLPAGDDRRDARISFLTRLARLEERRGRPGEALRAWRAVLAADPDHAEARHRALILGGSLP